VKPIEKIEEQRQGDEKPDSDGKLAPRNRPEVFDDCEKKMHFRPP
jgi:hypothetical protein